MSESLNEEKVNLLNNSIEDGESEHGRYKAQYDFNLVNELEDSCDTFKDLPQSFGKKKTSTKERSIRNRESPSSITFPLD